MAVCPPSVEWCGFCTDPDRALLVAITNNAGNANSYQSITMADKGAKYSYNQIDRALCQVGL
jgi:hypothetical protein